MIIMTATNVRIPGNVFQKEALLILVLALFLLIDFFPCSIIGDFSLIEVSI